MAEVSPRRASPSPVFLLTLAALVVAGLAVTRADHQEQILTQIQPVTPTPGLPAAVEAQIVALTEDKAARTPAQTRIDSQLLYKHKMAQGRPIARGVATLNVSTTTAADGREVVDVTASDPLALVPSVEQLGATVLFSDARMLRLQTSLDTLEDIAALPGVRFVFPAIHAELQSVVPPRRAAEPGRRSNLRTLLAPRLSSMIRAQQVQAAAIANQTSEGDVAHRANLARANYGVNGTGIRIGVMSSGVDGLAESQAAGALGNVTVLPGQGYQGNEGTAMLEIVHDLAPGAELYFATAYETNSQFATNIRALAAAGCQIIVDDVGYANESVFQDGQTVMSQTNPGIIAQAVKDVANAGVLYFSSSANSGNFTSAASGTYEGDFVSSGFSNIGVNGRTGTWHAFSYTSGFPFPNLLYRAGSDVHLFWADPIGASTNDYDLYVVNNATAQLTGQSINTQNGTQDPEERITTGFTTGDQVYVVKLNGAANRYFHLETSRGYLYVYTNASTHGHAATSAVNSFGVAAVPARIGQPNTCNGATVPNGPYPGVFTVAQKVECFSSDGPRRIFFNGDGTAITPGNFSGTGGQVLIKPDMAAADGVAVSGAGYDATKPLDNIQGGTNPFWGTSAAAPHAAAIAALVWSRNPRMLASEVRSALFASALDIMGAGIDRDAGRGLIMADTAVLASATVAFTDDPLTSGVTTMKAVHLTEMRTVVATLRSRFGLSTFAFTDPTVTAGATTLKAVHITELRTALAAVYLAGGAPAPTYSRPTLAAGTSITKADITELRAAIRAIY